MGGCWRPQPFRPAYLTKERIARAKKLKLALAAGIGSDHVDLEAAASAHVTVAEVTSSNSISVAEHAVMMLLSLVRNYRYRAELHQHIEELDRIRTLAKKQTVILVYSAHDEEHNDAIVLKDVLLKGAG